MNENTALRETLAFLRLEELKVIVKDFGLKNVRLAQPKDSLIEEICSSPTLHDSPEIMAKLSRIGEYFFSGGKQTLTLYGLPAVLASSAQAGLKDLFQKSGEVKFGKEVFRFKRFHPMKFQDKIFFVVEFDYPGHDREVLDYHKGPMSYTPISSAVCILRPQTTNTIFDIRCSASKASDFASGISGVIWGVAENGSLNIIPQKIPLVHDLSMKLRERFKARSFQVKITEADEFDEEGRLHPSFTEFLSKEHDLTDSRESLRISTSAEDQAHGLEFDDEFEGVLVKNGCKICLNYPTGQVCFKKTTSFGAYNKVIDTILELQDELG